MNASDNDITDTNLLKTFMAPAISQLFQAGATSPFSFFV
jgi:hypothetical protein